MVDQGNNRIRRITTDGLIQTVIGGGTSDLVDGVLSTNVKLDHPDGIAMGPDGTLYIATLSKVLRVSPTLPDISEKDNLIPSDDGQTLYRFDYRGRHLETIDAMTGVTELAFGYNEQGYLTNITDENGLETTTERDTSSNLPTAIVGPYGQSTKLELNDNGWSAKVTDPIERTYELTWNSVSGRLDKVIDPTAKVGTYKYDVTGRLERVTDPTGYEERIDAVAPTNGMNGVKITTKGGKVTEYHHKAVSTGGVLRSVTAPDSTTSE